MSEGLGAILGGLGASATPAADATAAPRAAASTGSEGIFGQLLSDAQAVADALAGRPAVASEVQPATPQAVADAAAQAEELDWPPPGLAGLGGMGLEAPATSAVATAGLPQPVEAALEGADIDPDAQALAVSVTGIASTPGNVASRAAAGQGFDAARASLQWQARTQGASAEALQAAASTTATTAAGIAAAGQAHAAEDAALTADGVDGKSLQARLDSQPAPQAGNASAFVAALANAQPMSQANAPLPAAEATAADVDAPTPTPDLHGDDFADAVGTRLQWLADQKIGHAQIRITPHDLGPVEVRLQVDGSKVTAEFISAQPEVRQALEQSLARLGEMLNDQGLQLAHADVGHQARDQGGGSGPAGLAGMPGEPQAEGDKIPAPATVVRRQGLLDAYA